MRKAIFIFLIILLALPQLNAQFENLRFGFQTSPTISWLSSSDKLINTSGTNLGIKVGSIVEYYLTENYIVTGGVQLHFNKGGQLLHDEGGDLWPESDLSDPVFSNFPDGVKLRYHLQYLEFPFGFRARTREFGNWRYFVEAPVLQFGFLTRSRGDIEGPGIPLSTDEYIRDEVRLLALTYGFGVGGEYSMTEDISLVTGLYYHRIFTDVTDDNGRKASGRAEDSKGTIGSVTIRLGVLF